MVFFQLSNIAYLIWLGEMKIYDEPQPYNLELCNETILSIATYHLILFHEMIGNQPVEYDVGWSFIAFVSLIFFLNFGYIILLNMYVLCRKLKICRLKRQRSELLAAVENKKKRLAEMAAYARKVKADAELKAQDISKDADGAICDNENLKANSLKPLKRQNCVQ